MVSTRGGASSTGDAKTKKPTVLKPRNTGPVPCSQAHFKAVDAVLAGLPPVGKDELVEPTPATTAALEGNYAKLLVAAGAGADAGVRIWKDAPRLKVSFDEMDEFMTAALQRHKNNCGGWAALARRGSTHAAATRYDVKTYDKHLRTIYECTLDGHSSGMLGSGGRELGAVVEVMKDEGHPVAVNLLGWLTECEELKGKKVDKFSIQKVAAGGRTGKHGDGDWGSACRDVLTILADESATKYVALFVGELKPDTGKGQTRYPRSMNVRLLGTLAQRHGETYTGSRMAMGVDAVLPGRKGGRTFNTFHQVLPGSPLTPMWNIVVDYK